MRYLTYTLSFALFLVFTSCRDDDDNGNTPQTPSNTFKINNISHPLTNCEVVYFGEWDGAHEYDILFYNGITFDSLGNPSGKGDILIFEIESTNETRPTAGVYSRNIDNDFFIWEGYFWKGYDTSTDMEEEEWDMVTGSFDLSYRDNNRLSCSGNFGFIGGVAMNPSDAILTYLGSFDFLDENDFNLNESVFSADREERRAQYRELIWNRLNRK
jgi:hypothetical protein